MANQSVEILILTRSVVLQQGLGALLESLPGIANVQAIKDLSNAYAWIASYRPDVVLLDVSLSGADPRPVLEMIQNMSGNTRRILLVDDAQGMNLIPQYADAVLIKGAAPSAVTKILTSLLSSKGVDHEHSAR